jgi:hypothetical protein
MVSPHRLLPRLLQMMGKTADLVVVALRLASRDASHTRLGGDWPQRRRLGAICQAQMSPPVVMPLVGNRQYVVARQRRSYLYASQ